MPSISASILMKITETVDSMKSNVKLCIFGEINVKFRGDGEKGFEHIWFSLKGILKAKNELIVQKLTHR